MIPLVDDSCIQTYNISVPVSYTHLIAGESFIELNTEDAQKLGVEDGEMVSISSRRGTIQAKATVSYKTNPGECWMPFHYIEGGANWLTSDALDSISSTPEYKVCTVKVEKITA